MITMAQLCSFPHLYGAFLNPSAMFVLLLFLWDATLLLWFSLTALISIIFGCSRQLLSVRIYKNCVPAAQRASE